MQTEKTTTARGKLTNVQPMRKKLTVDQIDLANQATGYSFSGMYVGTSQSKPFQEVDKKTGEVTEKSLTFAIFERPDGTRFKVIQDAGLQSALADALVTQGNWVEVVKLDKRNLPGGRTMNQYDIYALEAPNAAGN